MNRELRMLEDLPKEAWAAFGAIATVFTTFVLGLFNLRAKKSTSEDAAMQQARAELSSSQREFIKTLQEEMSNYHAMMADRDDANRRKLESMEAYMNKALEDERESCSKKMAELQAAMQAEIDDLKRRMFNEEAR